MKNRLTVAIASLLVASMGSVAFAQSTPPTNPQQPMSTTSSPYTSQSSDRYEQSGQANNTMSDSQVAQKVKQQLKNDGISSDDNLRVSVQDGTVTLRGTVKSQQDVNKIKSVAMQVQGVKRVDTSGLQVQGGQTGY